MVNVSKEQKNNPSYVLLRVGDKPFEPLKASELTNRSFNEFWKYSKLAAASYHKPNQQEAALRRSCRGNNSKAQNWKRLPKYSSENVPIIFYRQPRIPGLEFSVWKSRGKQSSEIVIVFRGTNLAQWGDWYSNFRWVTKYNSLVADQYEQTKTIVNYLIPILRRDFGSTISISAAGHSLGGGLAQQAGFSTPHISKVFAFASSPVTGEYGYKGLKTAENSKGLKIYLLNESGEVMAAGRWLHRQLFELPRQNPRVVELLFSYQQAFYKPVGSENFISQHNMQVFSCKLIDQFEW